MSNKGTLAQVVEHRPFKAGVAGSSPARLICGPFVYRLGHRVFNPVRGVRLSYGLHLPPLSRLDAHSEIDTTLLSIIEVPKVVMREWRGTF